jgi:hypothetical protein
MANEMPSSSDFTGLSAKVIQYSEAFSALVKIAKDRPIAEADWGPIEQLVDVDAFERLGVFLMPQGEVLDWRTYKSYVSKYSADTTWEGTLRHITETPGRVILELEERNARGGVFDVSNTVTIYEFTDAGKLRHLDVYVMPLGAR